MVDTNLRAVVSRPVPVAPGMRERCRRIVNLSTVSAYVQDRSILRIRQAGRQRPDRGLALELGPEITVNAIAPRQITESVPDPHKVAPDWAEEVVVSPRCSAWSPVGARVRRCPAGLPPFDAVTGITILDRGLRLDRLGSVDGSEAVSGRYSRSNPNARGPTTSRARAVRSFGGAGSVTTSVRYP